MDTVRVAVLRASLRGARGKRHLPPCPGMVYWWRTGGISLKSYDVLLFDLDGTLTDPSEGITNSVMHALRRMGVEPPERRALYKFIGPPLMDSFMQEYGFRRKKPGRPFPGIANIFRTRAFLKTCPIRGSKVCCNPWQSAGKRLAVATSKPEEFARRILAHFDLLGAV